MNAKTIVAVTAILLLVQPTLSAVDAQPAHPPDVARGFTIEPVATEALGFPTAINWGPGDGDGPDLFATMRFSGEIVRYNMTWTEAGPVLEDRSTFATGFNEPLGIAFDGDVAYVSDWTTHDDVARTMGVVYRVDDGDRTAVVNHLPVGAHRTNHLRFGPDGRLYIANGNSNDDGINGGPRDVFPYSGAILSVDATFVSEHPQVLEWTDDDGEEIPPYEIADHPVNDDFAENVTVVAHGFRNVFGVAHGPDGRAWTAMNGEEAPDSVYRTSAGTNYSFPFCVESGRPGATEDIDKVPGPAFPDASCEDEPTADALLGHHVCSTGLDVPTDGRWAFPDGQQDSFRRSVYVGECGPFGVDAALSDIADDPERAQRGTGHKVSRVELDSDGNPTEVRDFVTGLVVPVDVRFGPQGAMYIADGGAICPICIPIHGVIYRVAPAGVR